MSKKQKKSTSCSNPNLHYIGIDVSKDTLDLYHEIAGKGAHCVLKNTKVAIDGYYSALLAQYPAISVQFIFEATGTYSDVLVHSLAALEVPFSVISPEKSHSFMVSENVTNLTDKQCAEAQMHLKQLLAALDDLKKELRRVENQIHAHVQLVNCNTQILAIWETKLTQTKQHIQTLEVEIAKLSKDNFDEMIQNIETIVSVGKVTATAIVVATQGLQNCDSAKSLAKFVGLCPTQADSGTSVRKPKHIPKSGIGHIKSLLFNCARSALRHNPQIKAFFDKLVAKGKNGKVALTAVMHKLLRIIYGVAKSGLKYQPNFIITKNI
jgi:transposase